MNGMVRSVARYRVAVCAAVASSAAALASCTTPARCLAGSTGCNETEPCRELRFAFTCDGQPMLAIGAVSELGIDLEASEGVGSDIVLQNGRVTAVFDALDAPRGLATTGGSLIDFGPRGGKDSLNNIYQLAGILPDDTFAYDRVELIDESASPSPYVGVVMRGALDGRPDVLVATRYELHPCDPGLRVYSELYNGSAEPFVFILADTPHWGSRNTLPFVPQPGQGFDQPSFDLIDFQDVFFEDQYVLARAVEAGATTYGFLSCDGDTVSAVNDSEISAIGAPVALTRAGETRTFSRFISASPGGDLDAALIDVSTARTALRGTPPPMIVRARVTVGGAEAPGRLERSALLISADEDGIPRPLTVVVPDATGLIAASIPTTSSIHYQLWSFGRPIIEGGIEGGIEGSVEGSATGASELDLGTIDVPAPAILSVDLRADGGPLTGEVVIAPLDAATRRDVTGTWFDKLGDCAPWLGAPVGGSPACNQILVGELGATVELPAGRYRALATAGPGYTVAEARLDLAPGASAEVTLELQELSVAPPQWLAVDLHVHGRASFDSSLPDIDRVTSFVAHGIDVVVATDHDAVVDYADAVAALGLEARIRVVGGLETTPLIPFLDVPGSAFPHVIGHFNHWPLEPIPGAPLGGAIFDELIEPGELFDLLAPALGADGINMLNHPWDEARFGRDLGYLRAIGFDPRDPLPASDDGTGAGMLLRAPAGGLRNIDFDVMEIQNGAGVKNVAVTRPLWFSLLSQGVLVAGTSVSDSHSLTARLGYGRTWVDAGIGVDDFDVSLFNRALIRGNAIGSTGVVIIATIDGAGPSINPREPSADAVLDIEVRAAPWVPVTEVRAVSSRGEMVLASGSDLAQPTSPFGVGPVVRWRGSISLSQLIGPGDDWIVIEAGMPLPATADLDDDGVPDTSDNNGDGVIDDRDIEDPDDDGGPLEAPPDPLDESDIRFIYNQLLPEAWSYGFTNPFIIDTGGDGWQPPGLAARGAR